ncbi:PIN2/TERF1-interacting telomerase inhibitor 1 [Synchiropus picturatus]
MSMLAEPRRKQKWSVDPRNSTWSNDDSKFGQKMLERMGWSKGKGLGKSEQGCTDHLKVKLKNNNHGLGATASYEDNWIAHQDDFNELLAQLNSCHGQNSSSTEAQSEEQRSFSLEEKSKTSKKRVHYMKFTKGKDLSSRSETDLNCIFGKRAKSSRDSEQEGGSRDSPCEEETPADTESITKTVTSTLTMQEYFAQRMASLKKARAEGAPCEASSPVQTSDPEPDEPKKKKKKKKKRTEAAEVEGTEDSCGQVIAEDEQPSKKKKKRRKNEDDTATEISCATSGVEENCDEAPPSKKKKKKKQNENMNEQMNGHELTESLTEKSKKKKKKKRREETSDEV